MLQDPAMAQEPALTAATCAICHEVKEFHVITLCSKPENPRGHEPVLCLDCFEATIRSTPARPVPCPMCRAPIRTFSHCRADDLRQQGAILNEVVYHLVLPSPAPELQEPADIRIHITELEEPARRHPRVGQQQQQQQQQQPLHGGNTTFNIFRQQVLQREGLDLNHMHVFRAQLEGIRQELLSDAFRAFATQRIYQRLFITMRIHTLPCALLVQELVQNVAGLAPNGLCRSCFFPIGFHNRSVPNHQ